VKHPASPASRGSEHGFTLTELMAVVAILAIIAAIAIPSLTRDDIEARFNKFVKTFLGDVQRAHMGAISSKEDWLIKLTSSSYEIQRMPGPTSLEKRPAPASVLIWKGTNESSASWNTGYTVPGATPDSGTVTLKFRALGWMEVDDGSGTFLQQAATVFFGDKNGNYKARVVVFSATSAAQRFEGW
jgi:prepilin-type N-terminal cleavage/methylation domain-containing protein